MFLSHKISVDKHFINNVIEELTNELNAGNLCIEFCRLLSIFAFYHTPYLNTK